MGTSGSIAREQRLQGGERIGYLGGQGFDLIGEIDDGEEPGGIHRAAADVVAVHVGQAGAVQRHAGRSEHMPLEGDVVQVHLVGARGALHLDEGPALAFGGEDVGAGVAASRREHAFEDGPPLRKEVAGEAKHLADRARAGDVHAAGMETAGQGADLQALLDDGAPGVVRGGHLLRRTGLAPQAFGALPARQKGGLGQTVHPGQRLAGCAGIVSAIPTCRPARWHGRRRWSAPCG
jgi:hypothetical protein